MLIRCAPSGNEDGCVSRHLSVFVVWQNKKYGSKKEKHSFFIALVFTSDPLTLYMLDHFCFVLSLVAGLAERKAAVGHLDGDVRSVCANSRPAAASERLQLVITHWDFTVDWWGDAARICKHQTHQHRIWKCVKAAPTVIFVCKNDLLWVSKVRCVKGSAGCAPFTGRSVSWGWGWAPLKVRP